MATYIRSTLKNFFKTGYKPTEQQFADLIDSMLHSTEDASKLKLLLENLTSTNRVTKTAIRGADFCLNRRGKGDILSGTYRSGNMINILKGDFWIYGPDEPPPPGEGDPVVLGDWVIALSDQPGPTYDYNFQDAAKWQIQHFGDTTVNQQIVTLNHYRTSFVGSGTQLTMTGIDAQVVSITINKLTYYGKVYDGPDYGVFDFVYQRTGGNTVITINDELVGFQFQNSMVIDILYK